MTPLRSEDILASIKAFNDTELARRRDYYTYPSEDEPQTESFEQYLERYADIVKTGDTASAADIAELAARIAMPVPYELRAFYLTIGSLRCRTARLFALPELLGSFHGEATTYGIAKSLGIIDMIRLRWGNRRFEFDPVEVYIKQAEIDALNDAYICIGWYMPDDNESARYIYFDQQGNFGTLFYHQDAFDELYADDLLPMLTASPANQTLSAIVLGAMRAAAKLYSDDEDEDE